MLKRLIISLIAAFTLVILIYPLISTKKSPIYFANNLSREASLKLKIENDQPAIFNNRKITAPKISLLAEDIKPMVLGAETAKQDKKRILVDLSTQTLYAYDGDNLYMQALVSTGKWSPTPTGEFKIWVKLRATTMSGGSGADYYNLPNVPYVMYFANNEVSRAAGFSLHGAYWHNNFGHPMSHGCVNMREIDVKKLYEWANPVTQGTETYADSENQGTTVTIYGQAP